MISTKTIANLTPCGQPTSVHEIADRLFPAYKVDGGRVHLAGCTLDNRLFMQVTLRTTSGTSRFFLDSDGHRLDAQCVEELGLDNTLELNKPLEPAWAEIIRLAKLALKVARDEYGNELDDVKIDDSGPEEHPQGEQPYSVDVHDLELEAESKFSPAAVWCKYAQGKLRFTIGDRSVDLPFADWAKTLTPPPYFCRYTGAKTYHLAATSDGRIVAAEQLETCEASGRQLLGDDLITCSVSGQRVARDLAEVCPVSDENVLAKSMVECVACGERVSPNSIRGDRCSACRRMAKLARNDPRRERLFSEYPQLARRRWKIAETASVYILKGGGPFRRVLLVLDKATLEPRRLAVGSCLRPSWRQVDLSRIDQMLN